ncbi:MAG: GspH/FimT family pseudopilin [Stenotrophomonas sp.]
MSRRQAAGFTLIELLVVVAITGLAATAVLLTLPDGNAALYRQADGFGRHLQRAQEEAILGGRSVQVGVDASGYRFSRRDFGQWQPLDAPPLKPRNWAREVSAQLPQRHERIGFRFDPTGGAEPQHLWLARGDARVEISVDPAGQVRIR